MSWKRLIGTTFVAVLALCMVQGSVVKAEPEFIQLPGEAVELLDVNNTLYFSSSSGTHGNLSKTDGTVAGTEVITSDPASNITKVGNSVFFTTYNQTTQLNELWKTDGTPGDSMRLVEAIGFGTRFGEFNGRLLFTSIDKDNMYGHELWSSDGTVAGTHMVKDINPIGDGIRSRMALLHIGNAVYFSATDGVNDYKLWKTDGTEAGTVMVNDDPVTGDTNTGSLVEFNGKIVFNNTTSLWVSDGTAAGTYALNAPLVRTATDKKTVQAQQVGGTLFYTALDGTLWKTDGTAAGTAMVDPLRQIHVQNSNSPLTEFNGTLYFNGADGNNDYEFWKSDGTPAGTQLVANLKLIGASNPVYFKTYENNLYFSAFDQNSSHDVLWKYSGVPGSVPERFGSLAGDVLEKIVVSDVLYINQNAGTGYLKLWRLQEQEGITAPANLAAPSPAKVANLTWNTVAGADHYDVYRDGNSVGSTSVNSFNDNAPDGTYEYTVAAVGAGGVSSGPSGGVSVVIDNAVPAITGITWTANPLLQGQNATLSISANDALSGVSNVHYAVEGGAPQNMTFDAVSNTWKATFGSALAVNTYTITVTATDNAGNTSPASTDVLAVYNAANGYVTGHEWLTPSATDTLPIAQDVPQGNAPAAKMVIGFTNVKAATSTTPTVGSFDVKYVVKNNQDEFRIDSTSIDWLVIPDATHASILGHGSLTKYVNGVQTVLQNVSVRFDVVKGANGVDTVTTKIYNPGVDPNTGSPTWVISDSTIASQSNLMIKQ